jgi:DNA-binding LacI/PurR family transcriptional regulator
MPISLRDVAAKAGVSVNTVSCVLNDKKGAGISLATQERVRHAARELGYHPNAIARSLRRRSTNCIGYYRHAEHGPLFFLDPFNAAVMTGLCAECDRQGKDLLIHGSLPRDLEQVYLELTNGKVDGLVMLTLRDDPFAARLAASHLPVVAIANATSMMPSVTVDDDAGGRLLATHLAELGHRRVLYRSEPYGFTSAERRLKGFLAAAAEHGMDVTLSVPSRIMPELEEREIAMLTDRGPRRHTAIACWSDRLAFKVLAYCHKAGIRVPDDLAVVGFDGIETTFEMAYRLTTVRAPYDLVAETAVALLVEMINGKALPAETVLPVSLVAGDTT